MKKHILILLVALFGLGMTQALAQDPILPPTPLGECIDLDDPLNVLPGQEYTYEVNVPAPPGNKEYQWLVTQDITFIENGGLVATPEPADGTSPVLASGSAHYNELTADANTINLTWKSWLLNEHEFVFVLIYVLNEDGCTTDNLKVYRIRPVHAFTLDIANVDFDANDLGIEGFEQCVDDVQSAVFDPSFGDDGGVVYDFGTNTMYYVVAAAFFSTGYQLQAQFDGLQDATPSGSLGQEAMIYWDYTMAGLAGDPNGQPITNGATVTLGIVDAQDSPVGEEGEMIYIKVVIDHNSFEAADGQDGYEYNLAIDGVLTDSNGNVLDPAEYADIHHEDCIFDGFDNDIAMQVLKARPTVEPVNPDEFLPIAP